MTGISGSAKYLPHPGKAAWVGLIGYVIVYDLAAIRFTKPTLSETFYTTSQKTRAGLALFLFWMYLTGHLFRWIPRRFDILRVLTSD